MKYPDAYYTSFNPFEGEEGTIACRTVTLKKAKKEHPCFFGMSTFSDGHTIKPGETYRHEKALVDSDFWGEWKCCTKCIDDWYDSIMGKN